MFKLVDEARAWWPVTWPGVTEDGTIVENKIEVQFRLLDLDANLVLEADARRLDVDLTDRRIALASGPANRDQLPPSAMLGEFIGRVAIDWRGVAAANGEALAFSTENLARLMRVNGAFEAALKGYRDCVRGRVETRSGN